MDPNSYKREIDKLENELSSLNNTESKAPSVAKYKSYILIFLACFLSLWIIKPKIVLKISQKTNEPEIVLNIPRYIFVSLCLSVVVSLVYYIIQFKKKN